MVRIDKIEGIDRYVVVIPEQSLYQDFNPETGRPFMSQEEAEQWESKFLSEMISVSNPAPEPAPEPVPQREIVLAVNDFRKRFTFQERVKLASLALTDAEVKALYDDWMSASVINLDDDEVVFGLDLLIQKEVITEGRKLEILGLK